MSQTRSLPLRAQDGGHGKASGVLHWRDEQKGAEAVALPGPLKKRWRVVGSDAAEAGVPSLAAAALRQEAAAAAAEGAAAEEATPAEATAQ